MITVHHLENSRSQRVLWLLEELGLPYEVKRYARDPKTMLAPPELAQVHPLGKSPVISDDGLVVAESGAIVEYLVDTYGGSQGLKPTAGTPAHRQYVYWLHFAEGTAMPPLVMKLVFDKVRNAPVPFFIRPVVKGVADQVMKSFIGPNLKRQFAYMEQELNQRPWFAGDAFSAADIQMSFPLEAAQSGGALGDTHPKLVAWLQRIHARPAYQRALERGGPYRMVD